MHSRNISRGKQVDVIDGKNEIIKFTIFIALHAVQYQKQILQKQKQNKKKIPVLPWGFFLVVEGPHGDHCLGS